MKDYIEHAKLNIQECLKLKIHIKYIHSEVCILPVHINACCRNITTDYYWFPHSKIWSYQIRNCRPYAKMSPKWPTTESDHYFKL